MGLGSQLKPVIELYDLVQPVIIVEAPTGVIYTNQVGGTACRHPECEGYLLPLTPSRPFTGESAFDPFWGKAWSAEAIAAEFNKLRSDQIQDLRSEPDECNTEAWAGVSFLFQANGSTGLPAELLGVRHYGWLTWENSD